MPVLVTADFVWSEGETHFSQHRYRITSYVYDKQAGRYVQRDQGESRRETGTPPA